MSTFVATVVLTGMPDALSPFEGRKAAWHRSSRCGSNSCVEVATIDGSYLVRDSKNPDGTPLAFSAQQWQAFVSGVAGDRITSS